MSALADRFGDKEILLQSLLKKLRKLPSVPHNEPDAMSEFADNLKNILNLLRRAEYPHSAEEKTLLPLMESKLSMATLADWERELRLEMMDMKRRPEGEQKKNSPLNRVDLFINWLDEVSKHLRVLKTNRALLNNEAPRKPSEKSNRGATKRGGKKKQHAMFKAVTRSQKAKNDESQKRNGGEAVVPKNDGFAKAAPPQKNMNKAKGGNFTKPEKRSAGGVEAKDPADCCFCGKKHAPRYCKQPKPGNSLSLVMSAKLCISCLKEGHFVRDCPTKAACTKKGCTYTHHKFLCSK